jgi:HEAT repeat protein
VAALRDGSVAVRRGITRLEARTPSKSSRVGAALVSCLSDPDALVVAGAADALGEEGSESAVPALSAVATTHHDARCRESAVAALGSLGSPAGLDAVLHALSDKPAVRRRAVVALAAFVGPQVETALAAALEDKDWQVRQAAEALREGR